MKILSDRGSFSLWNVGILSQGFKLIVWSPGPGSCPVSFIARKILWGHSARRRGEAECNQDVVVMVVIDGRMSQRYQWSTRLRVGVGYGPISRHTRGAKTPGRWEIPGLAELGPPRHGPVKVSSWERDISGQSPPPARHHDVTPRPGQRDDLHPENVQVDDLGRDPGKHHPSGGVHVHPSPHRLLPLQADRHPLSPQDSVRLCTRGSRSRRHHPECGDGLEGSGDSRGRGGHHIRGSWSLCR